MALPEYPTKKIKTMVKFIPPKCRVVELGAHKILPVGSQVIPGIFKGNRILAEKVMVMNDNKKLYGTRQQINGSTFAEDQMPTIAGVNKQWKKVVRLPDANELKQNNIPWATTINVRVPGSTSTSSIMVHYMPRNVKIPFRNNLKIS